MRSVSFRVNMKVVSKSKTNNALLVLIESSSCNPIVNLDTTFYIEECKHASSEEGDPY